MLSLIINVALVSAMMLVFIISIYFLVVMQIENTNLKVENAQLKIDMAAGLSFLSDQVSSVPEIELKAKDDFIKFLSDSRDWSYQYIEDVQNGIGEFLVDIEPEILYFDEYGIVGSAYPHYYSMKKISSAYKKLKTLMPEDYGKLE